MAPSIREVPLFVEDGEGVRFAIVSEPADAPGPMGMVFVPGSGELPWANRGRFPRMLCHRLAAAGVRTIRFDFPGVGDSPGEQSRFWLGAPLAGDVLAAVRTLEDRGARDIVLVGFCYGARVALAAAPSVDRLRGLSLLSLPVHRQGPERFATRWGARDFLRRAARPGTWTKLARPGYRRVVGNVLRTKARSWGRRPAETGPAWVAPEVVDLLAETSGRGVPVQCLYGTGDGEYRDFQRSLPGPIGRVVEAAGDRIEVRTVDGVVHSLWPEVMEDRVTEAVTGWIGSLAP